MKKLFKSKIRKVLRDTLIARKIKESSGYWRYPFILFSWWLAKILVPRRKVKISGYKKAIITLKKGQSIDLTTGI